MERDAKVIAVGGIKHGQGITSIVFNLAYKLSSLINKKILIIDTNFLFKELSYITDQNSSNGIDDLISMIKTQDIPEEVFMLHTEQINKNLRIVNSSQIDALDYIKKNNEYMMKIIDVAKKYFDIIVIDASAGVKNAVIKSIFEKCDVFINVITQTPYIIDWYMKHEEYKGDKVITLINMYEDEVYPDVGNIKKDFSLENVVPLRYSAIFKHYYNQKMLEPFYKTNDLFNNDFAQLIMKIANMLNFTELSKMDLVNTNLLIKAKETKKKGFLAGLFGKK